MSWIKVIFANLIITMALLFILMISPPIAYKIHMYSKSSDNDVSKFNDVSLTEIKKVQTEYKDFIVWRRKDHRSETVNIVDGVRVTPNKFEEDKGTVWFFGGSTTWGYGVSDNQTYPFHVGKNLNYKIENFGETGYAARQSLAYLQNLLITRDARLPNRVVFYDGVNDVWHRCRSEINGLATGREPYINSKVQDMEVFSFQSTFNQLIKFAELASKKIFLSSEARVESYASDYYNCANDKKKADYIARTLVATWSAAKDLSERNGVEFLAVLQPHAYTNMYALNDEHLSLSTYSSQALSLQFSAVYPLIKEYAERANINFLDASSNLDTCLDCYFDFCHLRPSGNEKVARFLTEKLSVTEYEH